MTSPAGAREPDELDRALADAVAKVRTQRRAALDHAGVVPEILRDLALVPVWNVPLAVACGVLPEGDAGEQRLLQWKQLGWIAGPAVDGESQADDPPDAREFWMSEGRRYQVLQHHQMGPGSITGGTLAQLGGAILRVGVPIPPGTGPWAHLAKTPDPGSLLRDRLSQYLYEGDSGEALRYFQAATMLARVLGGELEGDLEWARRQLELWYGQTMDRQSLGRYMVRADQVAAIDALLEGPDSTWALHFIGAGGVGKTMLMRYLTVRMAPERDLAVSRVDFDFLSPDYPRRAPGLLLRQFAEDLRIRAEDNTAEHAFRSFNQRVSLLHEGLGESGKVIEPESIGPQHPDFMDLLEYFARAVRQLHRRTVLILDTCEELAKLRPDGTSPASVEATFRVLEALHERLPSLRVIFSGRRPLASAGPGWSVPREPGMGPMQLPERAYLRCHGIWGFSRSEALRYLIEHAGISRAFVEAIISRSPRSSDISGIAWENDTADTDGRYNPFDLALYADWVQNSPGITADQIRSHSLDRYIEVRILGRITSPHLRALLPVVALLGRVDQRMLREALPPKVRDDEAAVSVVLDELHRQEWVIPSGREFVEIDPALLPRLRSFYFQSGSPELGVAVERIGNYLERLTLEDRWSRLDVSHFDAALRVMPAGRALEWWVQIEDRIAREEAWDWALAVTERLLADGGAAALPSANGEDPPSAGIRAAILATHAAAQIHSSQVRRISLWWEVNSLLASGSGFPSSQHRTRLLRRATAGGVNDESTHPAFWQAVEETAEEELDEQLAAAYLAAVEALLELVELVPAATPENPEKVFTLVDRILAAGVSRELEAFACSLAGRAALLAKGAEHSAWLCLALGRLAIPGPSQLPPLESKMGMAPPPRALEGSRTQQTWLDWWAPEDLSSRIRLEFLRHTRCSMGPAALLRLLGTPPVPDTLDADRLASAMLALRVTLAPVPPEELPKLVEMAQQSPTEEPACAAHRAFPPFFVQAAEQIAAGQVDTAIDLLRVRGNVSEAGASQLSAVRSVERAMTRLSRRLRLQDEGEGRAPALMDSPFLEDRVLARQVGGLCGMAGDPAQFFRTRFDDPQEPELYWTERHAWWSSLWTRDAMEASAALEWFRASGVTSQNERETSFATLIWGLDAVEAGLLAARFDIEPSDSILDLRVILEGAERWVQQHTSQLEESLILRLRVRALGAALPGQTAPPPIEKNLLRRVGMRRAAEIALEEGELLALRVPEAAVSLLDQAHDWFTACGDPLGPFICRVCVATALARAGSMQVLWRRQSQLGQNYAAFQSAFPTPPPGWDEIEELAQNPHAESLDSLTPRFARPWLIRLLACLARLNDGEVPRERSAQMVSWVRNNYGITQPWGVGLTGELEGWLTVYDAQTAAHQGQARRFGATSVDASDNEGSQIVSIRLLDASDTSDPARAIQREHKFCLSYPSAANVTLRLRGIAPYHPAADLNAIRQDLVRLGKPVNLLVDWSSTGICWEAILLMDPGDPSQWAELPCYRTMLNVRSRQALPWDQVKRILCLSTTHFTDRPFLGVWAQWPGGPQVDLRSIDVFEDPPDQVPTPVLHVITSPVETSTGIRFLTGSQNARFIRAQRDLYGDDRGSLWGPADLVHAYPELTLCILQAPPDEVAERTHAHREQAAHLRVLAAELFQHGVPYVVTIPSLPRETVLEVLAALIRVPARAEPGHQGLAAAVAETRTQTTLTAREALLDVCLYANSAGSGTP